MTKIKKIVAAAVAAVSMGAVGVTAFAATHYYDFSIYGNTDSGYYEFSSRAYKDTAWTENAKVYVYRGNINSKNKAYVSVFSYDSVDYPGERITNERTVDHFTTANDPYILTYRISDIDDLSNKNVYLYADTGDEHVSLEGEWTP